MLDLIEQHRDELIDLCRQFEVLGLELFGSAARGGFDPARSDLDFLVVFKPAGKLPPEDRYFGLLFQLEDLLGRKIDLVDVKAHRNPYFMAEALKNRVRLYPA
jgi:hypothetical protein